MKQAFFALAVLGLMTSGNCLADDKVNLTEQKAKISYSAGYQVGSVIRGWTEALQMMKEGSKYELYIPSDLAYGERGAGSKIPPNSPLIFEVEVVSVKPTAPAKEAGKKNQ